MATKESRIAELARLVADHTARIDNHLLGNKLPYPSFEADGPLDLHLSPEIEKSRAAVLEASQELNDLLLGPRDLLFNHQHNQLLHLKLIARFGIADKVPVNGEISYVELANSTGIDESSLCRILRLGIAYRVFKEPRPGFIAHTAASRVISEDQYMSAWVGANVDDMWPAALSVPDALAKWPAAAEPNHTGFSLANKTESSFYEELEKDPSRARRFGGAMSFFTSGEGYAIHHLTDNYPWDSFGSGTLVDLGGSHGDTAFAIARKCPHLNCIVQELPSVVSGCSSEPGSNVDFMAHDFFEEQPVKHADVYLFRWIFHNWPDRYCLRILKALVPALKSGSRVLIMDFVMPPMNVVPNSLERKLRAMDVTMLEIGNAKERNLNEWKALLSQTDARLKFNGLTQPPGSSLALIEAIWEN